MVDNVAATLYPDDAPQELKPVMCFGDGNCLLRVVSIILFGNDDHHTELRMQVILELACNEKNYLDDSYLQCLTGTNDIVKNLLPSSVHFIPKNPSSCYRNEVLRTMRPGTFAKCGIFLLTEMSLVFRCNRCIQTFKTLGQIEPS